MKVRLLRWLSCMLLAVAALPAHAAKARVDDASHRVFGLAAKKYESLSGLRVSFTITRTGAKTISGTFSYAYLGKANLEWGRRKDHQRSVTNGDQFYEQLNGTYYTQSLAPGMPGLVATIWRRLPTMAGQIMDPFFSGESPAGRMAQDMTISLRSSGAENVLRGVFSNRGAGNAATLDMYFGRRDNLLHRVVVNSMNNGRRSVSTTSFGPYQINPKFAAATFNFKPGKGMKQYNGDFGAAPEKPAVKVGDKALTILGRDLSGKVRSLADYKGKIVLVDFWATWCGPCKAELPNIQGAYKRYHNRGFEVLSVSLDNDKKELQRFVKVRRLPWPQIYSGKAWQDPNARKYKVNAIPFMLLIGPDGRVAAIDPRGGELEKEIEKFMTGWT